MVKEESTFQTTVKETDMNVNLLAIAITANYLKMGEISMCETNTILGGNFPLNFISSRDEPVKSTETRQR